MRIYLAVVILTVGVFCPNPEPCSRERRIGETQAAMVDQLLRR